MILDWPQRYGFAGWLVAAFAVSTVLPAAEEPKVIGVGNYNGWQSSLYFEAPRAEVKVVVVPAVGGRICRYALCGMNILFEYPKSFGLTLSNATEPIWVGGYQCDLGPETREIPNHQNLWLGPYQTRPLKGFAAAVTSEPDAATGIQLEKEIVLDEDTGELGLIQRMKNISDKETAFCLWDRTLCKPGGFILLPLSKHSRHPARWALRHKIEGKYFYDGINPRLPNAKILKDVLVVEATGGPFKIGTDSDAEWIAYNHGRLLFVKYFPHDYRGEYPDGGNTVEVYWDNVVTELQPLSPEVKLKPGASYDFPAKWALFQLKSEVKTLRDARALVELVPPSPFRSGRH